MIEGTEVDLVRRCLGGDKRAFEKLIDRYQKQIFNIALRMLGNTNDAQEITQIVFVKAYEKLSTFNSNNKFFTWLYRIAINESINYRKSQKHHDSLVDDTAESTAPAPDAVYQTVELRASIEKALAGLKEEYRVVIVLRHFQDLAYEEIGQILDIPVKTVKSRLYTAREQLRGLLHQA